MYCENCKNKAYCLDFKKCDTLRGCGSGIPDFLPSDIANSIVQKVNRAVDLMGFDRAEYSREVVAEIKKALGV